VSLFRPNFFISESKNVPGSSLTVRWRVRDIWTTLRLGNSGSSPRRRMMHAKLAGPEASSESQLTSSHHEKPWQTHPHTSLLSSPPYSAGRASTAEGRRTTRHTPGYRPAERFARGRGGDRLRRRWRRRSVDVIYSRFATRAGTWSPCNET